MSWRLAESLKRLREQINAAYPNRDRTSDGSIGDTSHSARKSDHNPNPAGVVCAIDIDRDLLDDHDAREIVNALQASKDKRIKYIIFERQITVKGDVTQWKPYAGANAHNHHVHISVSSDPALYDNRDDWQIAALPTPTEATIPASDTHTVISGDTLWNLASRYQRSVSELKWRNNLTTDRIMVGQILKIR